MDGNEIEMRGNGWKWYEVVARDALIVSVSAMVW